jgi:small subunit ribosomal protein S20
VANHKSAKKRARQTEKRRARNRHVNSGVKTAVKALHQAPPEEQAAALRRAESVIRRAASKGVISKKQASRRVSRLAKRVSSAPAS